MSGNSSATTLKWGILSTANIAVKNLQGMRLSGCAEVVAVASRSLDKAQAFATQHSIRKAYGSYQELLDDAEIQAVYIPLPTMLHVEWVTKAAQAGKHVLVEKPVGISLGDAITMKRVCDENNVNFMDGVMWVHHPRTREVVDLVHGKKEIGNVHHMHSVLCFRMTPERMLKDIRVKKDGDPLGCLGDVGWYNVSAFLVGNNFQVPKSVFAQALRVNEEGVPLAMSGVVTFQDCVCTFECGFLTQKRSQWELAGETGTITMNDFHHPRDELNAEFRISKVVDGKLEHEVRTVKSHAVQHAVMFQDFTDACLRKEDAIIPWTEYSNGNIRSWGDVALLTQTVVDALDRSWKSGKVIEL